MITKVKSEVEIMKVLIKNGYKIDDVDGVWCRVDKADFLPAMWKSCGKKPLPKPYYYEPEWLEDVLLTDN